MALDFAETSRLVGDPMFRDRVRSALATVAGRTLKPSSGDVTPTDDETSIAHAVLSGVLDEEAIRFVAVRNAAHLDGDEQPTDPQVRAAVTDYVSTLTIDAVDRAVAVG